MTQEKRLELLQTIQMGLRNIIETSDDPEVTGRVLRTVIPVTVRVLKRVEVTALSGTEGQVPWGFIRQFQAEFPVLLESLKRLHWELTRSSKALQV